MPNRHLPSAGLDPDARRYDDAFDLPPPIPDSPATVAATATGPAMNSDEFPPRLHLTGLSEVVVSYPSAACEGCQKVDAVENWSGLRFCTTCADRLRAARKRQRPDAGGELMTPLNRVAGLIAFPVMALGFVVFSIVAAFVLAVWDGLDAAARGFTGPFVALRAAMVPLREGFLTAWRGYEE